ncbi:LptF/LptG family permease [Candidatus Riflebacteria bacterium]
MFSKLDRYIFTQTVPAFLFGIAIFVSIFVVDLMINLLDMIFTKGVSLLVVLKLFFLALPPILVITLPMAILLGVLLGFGRLSADGEITAFKAGGIGIYRIIAPMCAFGIFLCICVFILNEYIVPTANQRFTLLMRNEVFLKQPLPKVAQNEVFEAGTGRKFFVRKYKESMKLMLGVTMLEYKKPGFPRMVEAQSARLGIGLCKFWDGKITTLTRKGTEKNQIYFKEMEYPIDTHSIRPGESKGIRRGARSMTFSELKEYIKLSKKRKSPKKVILKQEIELFTKTSLPFASFVFILIGAPLAFGSRRHMKSSGVGLAIIIIFGYYVLMAAGKAFARSETLTPFLGAWLPNFVLMFLGFILIYMRRL